MIESKLPETWEDLQRNVTKILLESGFEAETPKLVETVRGKVEIDVYAVDNSVKPATIYLCECKHWKTAIPQTVVHGFRSVVSDYGANWGLIISANGFQSGAFEVAKNSNIKLLDWQEFQNLFIERWYTTYFCPNLYKENESLVDYTEPINSRVFRKADLLTSTAQEQFKFLRGKYVDLAYFALSLYVPWRANRKLPVLPLLDEQKLSSQEQYTLPNDILTVVTYRELLNILIKHIREGLEEFDNVFGGRA